MKEHFDIVIIGSGPGGYTAAVYASRYMKKVALIEKDLIGGVCLNRGCIPTKSYFASAQLILDIQESEKLGVHATASYNFSDIFSRKQQLVTTLRKNLENLILSHGVKIFHDAASFVSEKEILLKKENRILSADHIIVATGSAPAVLPSPLTVDNDKILDSSSVLELSSLPSSLAIIGGGYIGCEMGCLFSAMGVKVTIIEMKNTLIPNQEPKIQTALMNLFKKRNITFFTKTAVKDVKKTEKGVHLSLSNGNTLDADYLLIAVGNSFQTKGLQLDKANIHTRPDGSVQVNENMQTNISHIYAIGDINKTTMLAHGASHQAIVAVDHMRNHVNKKKSVLPFVIFTVPEIASVGLTSMQAKEKNIDFSTAIFPYTASGMAQTLQKTEGFALLHYEKNTKKILGAHVFGKEGSELIAEMTVAINQNLTLDDIAHTIYTHPTLSEIWHDTAMLARDLPIHLPPVKK